VTIAGHCNIAGCTQDVASSLDGEVLCREHFICHCYTQLERYAGIRKGHVLSIAEEEAIRQFVQECVRKANETIVAAVDLDNLHRARMLDIIEEATDLARHLRRSPRMMASIVLRLHWGTLGDTLTEDTGTVSLSRHGASLYCSHPARSGERLQIIRTDTGQKAEAQVTWQRPSGDKNFLIGVEFVDCDDFWALNWAEVEIVR
jgi:hypothetical protein